MNEYRSTINLPECKRGQVAMFPDTPRVAILVSTGILVPKTRRIMDAEDVPTKVAPVVDIVRIEDDAPQSSLLDRDPS